MRPTTLIKITLGLAIIIHGATASAQTICYRRQPHQLLKVATKDGKVAFINKHGRIVMRSDQWPANILDIGEFHEGLAVVKMQVDGDPGSLQSKKLFGYINQKGRVIIGPQFDAAEHFCGGFAWVHTEKFHGIIDRAGKRILDVSQGCNWPELKNQQPSLWLEARVCRWVWIDGVGHRAAEFSEGLAAVADGPYRNAKYGFIDEQGKVVIPPRFEPEFEHHGFIGSLTRFSDGMAKVKLDGKYGYINKSGELVVPAQFSSADDFSEGLACVYDNGKSFYIDHQGRKVIAAADDWETHPSTCSSFSEGLAMVRFKHDKFGYIDRTGRVVIQPRFDSAGPFVDGVAEVYELRGDTWSHNPAFGFIDRKGKYIWEPQRPHLRRSGNN